MTYLEWKDELKGYLRSLPQGEQEKVFAYFAEMYADKRDAGIDEKDIIIEFGAPYDVAKRILAEEKAEGVEVQKPTKSKNQYPNPYLNNKSTKAEKVKKSGKQIRVTKIIAIALGVLLGVALLSFVISLFINGCRFAVDFTMETYTASSSAKQLEIEVEAGSVDVAAYDGDRIIISYPDSEREGYTVFEANGKITLKPKDVLVTWFKWYDCPDTIIQIPQSLMCSLDIEVDAGSVKIASGNYSQIALDVDAGSIQLENIQVGDLNAKVDAGEIKANNVLCDRSSFGIDAGNLDLNQFTCDVIYAEASVGEVNIEIIGNKSDYTIVTEIEIGSTSLPNQNGTGGKHVEVSVDVGNIIITFND